MLWSPIKLNETECNFHFHRNVTWVIHDCGLSPSKLPKPRLQPPPPFPHSFERMFLNVHWLYKRTGTDRSQYGGKRNRFYGSFGTPFLPSFYSQEGEKIFSLVYFFPPRFPKRGRNCLLISMALRWIVTVQQVAVCTEFDALTLIPELLNVTFWWANMKVTLTSTRIFITSI